MGFNLENYTTVAERLAAFWAKHEKDDPRILTELLQVQRDESGRPLQYITMTKIYFGDVLKAQDLAEEIVGSSPVNRTSALENASTSSLGRALSLLGFMGIDPVSKKPVRPSREEMEKVERAKSESVVVQVSNEQLELAKEALEQVPAITSMAELKMFYTGAQKAGLLNIAIDGKTLNSAVATRKKELEGAK